MKMKKYICGIMIISITFLTSGCVLQDKIKMNKIEKVIKEANTKEYGNEDTQDSIVYKLMKEDYNQIVYFKDKNTGADTYAFRVQTDFEIGNGGIDFFNYEIGRIMINPQNIKSSKCSYNFGVLTDRNSVKWVDCSDTSFMDSIPKIAEMKKSEFEKYNKLMEYVKQEDICSMGDNSETIKECKSIPEKYLSGQVSAYDDAQKQLDKLIRTTL